MKTYFTPAMPTIIETHSDLHRIVSAVERAPVGFVARISMSTYPRMGHPIAPSRLAPLLERKVPRAGVRFCELDASAWDRFSETRCRRFGKLLVEHLKLQLEKIKYLVGSQTVSPIDPRVSLDQLDLEVRTYNCLIRADIEDQPGGIGGLMIGEALVIPGFGVRCLVDLLSSVEAAVGSDQFRRWATAEQGLISHDVSTAFTQTPDRESLSFSSPRKSEQTSKTAHRNVNKAIDAILSVPDISFVGRSDPRLGRLLRNVHSGVATIGELADCRDQLSTLHRGRQLKELRDAIQRCLEEMVETELLGLLVTEETPPRDVELIRGYHGLGGQPALTLKAMGEKYNLSRERVRQICAPTSIVKISPPPFAPAIDSAIRLICDTGPALCSSVEAQLVENGLAERGTSLQSIKRIAQLLGREADFEFAPSGTSMFVLPAAGVACLKQIEQTAGKLVRHSGAATIDGVVGRCRINLPDSIATEFVASIVASMAGFRWLDQSSGWFWFESGRSSSLLPAIRKVISVCSRIDVGELHRALRRERDRRGHRVPPKEVLLELCRQLSDIRVVGERVMARRREDAMTLLKGDEAKMVKILLDHGPLCHREVLLRIATTLGIGIPSFNRCLYGSATISRYAPNVYGLTGTRVRPEMLQSVARRSRASSR